MTNGELIDILQGYSREANLLHQHYAIERIPDDRLVVDAVRLRGGPPPPPLHRPDGITEVKLTQGKTATIRTEDWEKLKNYKWHVRISSEGRCYASANFRTYTASGLVKRACKDMHQMLMPEAFLVDHFDGNGLNNCRENLRDGNKSINAFNQIPKREAHGVYWATRNQRWIAHMKLTDSNGKRTGYGDSSGYLGSFLTMKEALEARAAAEAKLPAEYKRGAFMKS